MAWSWSDAFKGGTQAALLTAKTGNPYVIGGSALVGALAQGYSSESDKIDPAPYRRAMERLRKTTRGRTNRAKKESSSQLATNLRSRGMAGGLAEGIAEGNRRMVQQRSDDYLNEQESNLEMSLADAEVGFDRRKSARKRQDTANLGIAALSTLSDIGDPDEFDSPFYKSIQEKLGIEPFSEDSETGVNQYLDSKQIAQETVDDIGYEYLQRDDEGNLSPKGLDKGMQSDGPFLRQGIDHPIRLKLNEIQNKVPNTAKVSMQGDSPYIQPQGSNVSFSADSSLGAIYIENAPGLDYMARNIPGGWEELMEYLG